MGESRGGVLELPQDLTLDKNRLIVPGRSVDPDTGNWDIIVRTYNAQPGG